MTSSPESRRLKIAVADDDVAFLDLLRDVLEEYGHEVRTFMTIDEAYQAIVSYQPDVIIVDLLFPESKHGIDLISMLWLTEVTRHIPVIVCSAATAELREMQAYLHKKNIATLYKPFDLDELIDTVTQALRLAGVKPGQEPPETTPVDPQA